MDLNNISDVWFICEMRPLILSAGHDPNAQKQLSGILKIKLCNCAM